MLFKRHELEARLGRKQFRRIVAVLSIGAVSALAILIGGQGASDRGESPAASSERKKGPQEANHAADGMVALSDAQIEAAASSCRRLLRPGFGRHCSFPAKSASTKIEPRTWCLAWLASSKRCPPPSDKASREARCWQCWPAPICRTGAVNCRRRRSAANWRALPANARKNSGRTKSAPSRIICRRGRR